jgi:hypothetical protein
MNHPSSRKPSAMRWAGSQQRSKGTPVDEPAGRDVGEVGDGRRKAVVYDQLSMHSSGGTPGPCTIKGTLMFSS